MDVIGPIEPKASNGHQFILVAIDFFTKWVEAASYANIMQSVVTKFMIRELIFHYGIPNKIITDNATNLNNKSVKEIIQKMVPFALHGYRTSVPTSTGATSFSLVYAMEAVLPIEVKIPSLRVLREEKLEESEWIQNLSIN
ncbi:uncharacterized protein [Arachis hypogaea]|uniref:uncharacterized protein n=1 Tax=Arachis hypogaea TaxID=3818 RepID=UPI003B20E812